VGKAAALAGPAEAVIAHHASVTRTNQAGIPAKRLASAHSPSRIAAS
jgi:hypothetical protein